MACKQPAHEVPDARDAARDVGEVAEEGLQRLPRHGGPGEPSVALLEDHSELVVGDTDCHSLRADLEAKPDKAVGWGHTLVGGEAEAQAITDCLEALKRLTRIRRARGRPEADGRPGRHRHSRCRPPGPAFLFFFSVHIHTNLTL